MASGGGVVTNEVLFSRATRENVHKPTRGFITTKASFAKPRGSVHSFDFQEHLHTFKFCEKNIPKFQKSTRAYMRQIIALQDSMIRFTNELNLLIDEETSHEANKATILALHTNLQAILTREGVEKTATQLNEVADTMKEKLSAGIQVIAKGIKERKNADKILHSATQKYDKLHKAATKRSKYGDRKKTMFVKASFADPNKDPEVIHALQQREKSQEEFNTIHQDLARKTLELHKIREQNFQKQMRTVISAQKTIAEHTLRGCLQVQRHLPSKQLLREYYRVKEENTLISDNNRIASADLFHIERDEAPTDKRMSSSSGKLRVTSPPRATTAKGITTSPPRATTAKGGWGNSFQVASNPIVVLPTHITSKNGDFADVVDESVSPVLQSPSPPSVEPSAAAAAAAGTKTTGESGQHIEPSPTPPQRLPAIHEIQESAAPASPQLLSEALADDEEIARLEAAKLAAAEIEDFSTAAALKKQITALKAAREAAGTPVPVTPATPVVVAAVNDDESDDDAAAPPPPKRRLSARKRTPVPPPQPLSADEASTPPPLLSTHETEDDNAAPPLPPPLPPAPAPKPPTPPPVPDGDLDLNNL